MPSACNAPGSIQRSWAPTFSYIVLEEVPDVGRSHDNGLLGEESLRTVTELADNRSPATTAVRERTSALVRHANLLQGGIAARTARATVTTAWRTTTSRRSGGHVTEWGTRSSRYH